MDFSFSYEQDFLEQTARQLATDEFGPDVARAAIDGDRSAADRGWGALAGAGWIGLRIREELGGSGAGLVEACIVAEALACALAPVPYVGTAIAAPSLLEVAGGDTSALLSDIANGRSIGIALAPDLSWPNTAPAIGWECGSEGQALTVGVDGPEVVTCEPLGTSADLLHPLWSIPGGASAVVPSSTDRSLAAMRMGCAAALVGTLRGASELAFQYVKERKQYGKTIGSFQAVQHMCADVEVALESCRSVLYGAAWTVENATCAEAVRAATVAKSWCADSVVTSVETVVQVLGGIGVTWESDAHLYLRQAHLYAGVLGDRRRVRFELGRAMLTTQEASDGSA
jgi:alkylation response protein AidB-like acyl-CoA dehydrogenase